MSQKQFHTTLQDCVEPELEGDRISEFSKFSAISFCWQVANQDHKHPNICRFLD